jgi:hypothetical protein
LLKSISPSAYKARVLSPASGELWYISHALYLSFGSAARA